MLPKIDTPIYFLTLPLSQKEIKFRPFLVKEQKNLLMALESDESDSIEKNIKQILHNCTITENIDIEKLPILDIEYYFINLRARSVGEIVENKYICNNEVEGTVCGNRMDVNFNILDIKVEKDPDVSDVIQITDKISIKLKYPEFKAVNKLIGKKNSVDIAFEMIAESIEYVFDGDQYYYANESTPQELLEFVESLDQKSFSKIEKFFESLPKLNKTIDITCTKCGFQHKIVVEGLESFFG